MLRTLLLALALAVPGAVYAQAVTVFAAASLADALQRIEKAYSAHGGGPVRYSFAATSTLAKQIESGAEADLFIAADEQWMDYLAQRRLIDPATRVRRVGNTLVLVTPAARAQAIDIRPGFDLAARIGDARLVTGDPAHVPVGRYAQQALTRLGVWDAVAPKLARTDNVRAALILVERGEAPFGIVYGTDAQASTKVRVAGVFPADTHAPITYPMAIVAKRDRPEVRRFFDFLGSPEALQVFREAGFPVLP
jgi:molybdate transport system substrate-binding protein